MFWFFSFLVERDRCEADIPSAPSSLVFRSANSTSVASCFSIFRFGRRVWVQEGVVPGSLLLKVLFVCSSANAVTSPSLRHRWLSVSKAKSEADGGAFEVTSVSSSSKDLASRYVAVAVVK